MLFRSLNDACKVTKNGTATPPMVHTMTAEELNHLGAQHMADAGAQAFHDAWGGVKIKVAPFTPDLWPPSGGNPASVVGPYGIVRVKAMPNAEIHDGLYYVKGSMAVCETGPKYADMNTTFDFVQGFHYLDYCTWSISNLDKCADLSPQSDDCKAMNIASCP